MRALQTLVVITLALLLGGGVLAQGEGRPFKTYLPGVGTTGSPGITPTPVTPTPVTPTPVTPTPVTPTPVTPTPVTPTPLDYDGVWWGVTSQGKPIGFTVAGNALTLLEFGYVAEGSCTTSGTTEITFNTPKPIVDDGFGGSSPGFAPNRIAHTLSGSFGSETAASGTLTVNITNSFPLPPCSASASVTWTAAKGAAEPDPTLTATVRIVNDTGGSLSYTLTGPTPLAGSVGPGSHYLAVRPGSYQLAVTASCGSDSTSFSVEAGELISERYFCVTVPGRAALSSSIDE